MAVLRVMFGDEVTRKDILSFQEIMVRFWETQIKLMPARKRSAEERVRAAGYRHAHNYIGRKISFERKKSAPAYNRTCFPTQMVFLRAEGRG